MDPARPLREVFAELTGAGSTGDPGGLLRDLPDELVAEAVVSYAETAPLEIAEHLAPFVSAHSAVGSEWPAPEGWLDLLATAPAGEPGDGDAAAGAVDDLGFGTGAGLEPAGYEGSTDTAGLEPDDFHASADPAGFDEIAETVETDDDFDELPETGGLDAFAEDPAWDDADDDADEGPAG
jgi:hypothetical protein